MLWKDAIKESSQGKKPAGKLGADETTVNDQGQKQ